MSSEKEIECVSLYPQERLNCDSCATSIPDRHWTFIKAVASVCLFVVIYLSSALCVVFVITLYYRMVEMMRNQLVEEGPQNERGVTIRVALTLALG